MSWAGIGLTPSRLVREVDNTQVNFISFRIGDCPPENKKLIYFKPPDGWSFNGDSRKFTLRSDGMNPAEVTFDEILFLKPTFDQEKVNHYAGESFGLIPEGGCNSSIVSMKTNPTGIGGHPTTEIVLSYSLFGQPLQMSVFYLDMGRTLLRIKMICEKQDFDARHQILHQSLHSWKEN